MAALLDGQRRVREKALLEPVDVGERAGGRFVREQERDELFQQGDHRREQQHGRKAEDRVEQGDAHGGHGRVRKREVHGCVDRVEHDAPDDRADDVDEQVDIGGALALDARAEGGQQHRHGRADGDAERDGEGHGERDRARDGQRLQNADGGRRALQDAGEHRADEHAEQRVFGNVGALKGLKEKKPGLIIGLCGCMANQKHVVEKLRQSYPYVDLVFGVDGIDTLPQLIAQKLQKHKRVLLDPAQRPVIVENIPIRRESEFRAWLPIMYGCDNFCTYCIVPYVRGRERSREPAAILAEFRQLVEQGYKEITLLGQNVNSYGKGLEHPIDFADLLNLLCEVPGDYQIRFMTSHPKDLSDELIDVMAHSKHILPQFHLPVQHGNDEILRRMNRHYNRAQYLDRVRKLREAIPAIGLTTDIIVGFPGETEEQFQDTLSLVREVGYDSAFTFIYSPRTGTGAAKMPNQVPEDVSSRRIQELLKVQEECQKKALKRFIGTEEEVLVEGLSRRSDTDVSGHGLHGLSVTFPGTESDVGEIVRVKIVGAKNNTLTGERI